MSGSLPDTVTVEDNRLMVKKVDNAMNTTFICEVKNKHGASSNQITTFVIGEFVRPAGSHAGTQTSTIHALLNGTTHRNIHMSHAGIGFQLRVARDAGDGSLLIFTTGLFLLSLFLPVIFWLELAELVWLTLPPRGGPTL